jgi:tRNA (adenine57-N1/adenine58-N1)-methyltransferase
MLKTISVKLMSNINVGDHVLLYLTAKKNWLIRINSKEEFHTHAGIIKLNELIGKPFGCQITTSQGIKIRAFKPILSDIVLKMKRTTQIIYPKDVGVILSYSGISNGHKVAEAGIGSGGLTLFLANAVMPDGKVYGYDIREESIKATTNNLKKYSLFDYVEIRNHDVCEGFIESELDLVILDLATPWLVVPKAFDALRSGGMIISYSPTIEQTQKAVNSMKNLFDDIRTYECLIREILVREDKTRPTTFMVGHTGYMSFARKILNTI